MTTKVRVRLLGSGRLVHLSRTLNLSLLFSRCRKQFPLLGAATTRTLWTLVNTSIDSGQQTTGPLQTGNSRPDMLCATGRNWALELFVRTTFPTPVLVENQFPRFKCLFRQSLLRIRPY